MSRCIEDRMPSVVDRVKKGVRRWARIVCQKVGGRYEIGEEFLPFCLRKSVLASRYPVQVSVTAFRKKGVMDHRGSLISGRLRRGWRG